MGDEQVLGNEGRDANESKLARLAKGFNPGSISSFASLRDLSFLQKV